MLHGFHLVLGSIENLTEHGGQTSRSPGLLQELLVRFLDALLHLTALPNRPRHMPEDCLRVIEYRVALPSHRSQAFFVAGELLSEFSDSRGHVLCSTLHGGHRSAKRLYAWR